MSNSLELLRAMRREAKSDYLSFPLQSNVDLRDPDKYLYLDEEGKDEETEL